MTAPKKERDNDNDSGNSKMPSQSDRGSSPNDYEGKQSYRDSGDEFDGDND